MYVQFGRQKSPKELWPQMGVWSRKTNIKSGVFFRALGGLSSQFETYQEQSYPRLMSVRSRNQNKKDDRNRKFLHIYYNNQWSKPLSVGTTGEDWMALRFRYTDNEVRPRNQAIRIWIKHTNKKNKLDINLDWNSTDSMKNEIDRILKIVCKY